MIDASPENLDVVVHDDCFAVVGPLDIELRFPKHLAPMVGNMVEEMGEEYKTIGETIKDIA